MKITVFGGQGFLGTFLVDNLLEKGHKVTVFDRIYDHKKWKDHNWEGRVSFFLGDIRQRESVFEAVNLCDRWVNLAGLLGTSEMIHVAAQAVEVNILGALNVFDGAVTYKKTGLQVAVGNYWMNNPYSITRNTTERFALMYNKEKGTDIRIVRPMNAYGEGQKHRPVRKIFPNIVIPALLNKDITIYGDGEQVMDLVYVGDIAEVVARIVLADDIPNDIIYEAGVGGGQTINKSLDLILKKIGSESKVNRVQMRPGEEPHAVVEITEEGWENLKKHINYSPDDLTPMDEAIDRGIAWYKENLDDYPWDE